MNNDHDRFQSTFLAWKPVSFPKPDRNGCDRHDAKEVDMRRIRFRAVAIVGLIVLLGLTSAACSKTSTPPASESSSQAPMSGGVTLEQGPGDALVFSPTELTVKQGDTITVKNVSSMPHTFTITGKGIDVVNQPGQTTNVTIDLPPGTYDFICRFHVSSGMKGTLIVQ